MFCSVLIDQDNKDLFLPGMDLSEADLWVGVVEEETSTACGLLGADYVPEEKERFSLSVTYLQMPKEVRKKGALETLFAFVVRAAYELSCVAVYEAESVDFDAGDGTGETLLKLGFRQEEKSVPLYSFFLWDISIKTTMTEFGCLRLSDISRQQWESFCEESDGYSFSVMERETYDEHLSLFLVDDDRHLQGGILFRMRGEILFVEVLAPYGGYEQALINDLIYWGSEEAKIRLGREQQVQMYLPESKVYHQILMEVTKGEAKKIQSLTNFIYELPV